MRIWHDKRGTTRWGLDWKVLDPANPAQWIPLLAEKIIKLDWDAWWLDVPCLSETLDLPADDALNLWGTHFWDAYPVSALVLLDVGQERRAVYQAVRHWEAKFATVKFSSRHDYDSPPPVQKKTKRK